MIVKINAIKRIHNVKEIFKNTDHIKKKQGCKYIFNIHSRNIKIHVYHVSSFNVQQIENAERQWERLYIFAIKNRR